MGKISALILLIVMYVVASTQRVLVTTKDYIILITDVHNYYKTSCVLFVQSGNYEDLKVSTVMHTWSREFSRQGVLSLAITFPDLLADASRYRSRIVRPLFVVLLTTRQTLNEFVGFIGEFTKKMEISYPVWLVLFMEYPGHPLKEICMSPSYNVFNVDFKTEMLVLCYDYPKLNEWYALRDNKTRFFNLANWTTTDRLVMTTNKSLYARRSDLSGEVLRAAIVKESPFITAQNGVLGELFGGVVTELARVMNFKVDVLEPVEAYGSWNEEDRSWTGVVGQLVTGKADIGVAEFTVTNHRLSVVDFTLPLILSRNRFYIKQPDGSAVQWSGYFKAFHWKIWAVIIGVVLTTPILLTFIKTRGCIATRIATRIATENYVHVWGIYCQQEFPPESSLRLAFLSIFVSALIVSSAYSASLISFLTVNTASLPFSDIDGLAADRSYKLIVFRNSADYDLFATAKDNVLSKLMQTMKRKKDLPLTLMEGFQQVCLGKTAFYTTEAIKNAISIYVPCAIVYIESGRADSLAMALRKGSPYTGLINYHLQRFQDNGVLQRLKQKYLLKSIEIETAHPAVSLWGIAPILAVVAGGALMGTLVLFAEKAYDSLKNRTAALKSIDVTNSPGTRIKKITNQEAEKVFKYHAARKVDFIRKKMGYWP